MFTSEFGFTPFFGCVYFFFPVALKILFVFVLRKIVKRLLSSRYILVSCIILFYVDLYRLLRADNGEMDKERERYKKRETRNRSEVREVRRRKIRIGQDGEDREALREGSLSLSGNLRADSQVCSM